MTTESDSPIPFESLAAMQAEHAAVVKAVGTDVLAKDHPETIARFVRRGVATGTVLDAREDRAAAQALINFWAARLTSAAREAARKQAEQRAAGPEGEVTLAGPDAPPVAARRGGAGLAEAEESPVAVPDLGDTLLAEFEPGTIRKAMAAADAWLKRQPDADRALARRVMLRLVRLRPDEAVAGPVPTVRAALYDLDAPERVNAVLGGLAAAGVVRVTPGESPEMDRVALRSRDLIAGWDTFQGWVADRVRVRGLADGWARAGRPADRLADGPDLEELRRYHDRNPVEREYVNASVYHQARKLEQAAADRRAKLLWRGLAAIAVLGLIGTVVGAVLSVRAERQRAEADRDRDKAERERAEYEGQVSRGELITAQQHLDEVHQELAIRNNNQKLANMTRVIRALAELGTTSGEERRMAEWRWVGLVESLRKDRDFQEYLARHDIELDKLRPAPNDDKRFREFAHKALNVARSLKAEAERTGDSDTIRTLGGMRAVAYQLVEQVASRTVEIYGDPRHSFADAAPLVREFWILYWGEMGLFEGNKVATAMRDFGDKLKDIETHVNRQLLTEDKQLSDDDRKLLSGQSVTQALSEWKNRPDRRAEYVRLANALVNRPIPARLVNELKARRDALRQELKAELGPGGGAAAAPLPTAY